jgi:hypothetical protein
MRTATGLLALLIILAAATSAVAGKPQKCWENWEAPTRQLLDCSNAVPIACGDVVTGSNTGLPNNVDYYSCISWNEAGGEAVYELVIDNGCYEVTATISNMVADLDVFILASCDEADCIGYGNESAYTSCLSPGTYYIVVDGYYGAVDTFTLTVDCVECDCPSAACCPSPYTCYEIDYNLDPYGYLTEPCDGEECPWEWGVPVGIPMVACDDVPVTNVLGTVLAGNYTNCGQRVIAGTFEITDSCWCLELCHYYDTEARYDGGNVKISTDGGSTWQIIAPARGYDDVAYAAPPCIAGQPVFTGHQYSSAWLRDCFDLSDFAGQEVTVAFDFGADSSVFYPGWYIKWVKIGGDQGSPSEKSTWGSIKSRYNRR